MDPEVIQIAKHMMTAEHGENPNDPRGDILRSYIRYAYLAWEAVKSLKKCGLLPAG